MEIDIPRTTVTFGGLPARATSRASRGGGRILDFLMLERIQSGGAAPLTFTAPQRPQLTILSSKPERRTSEMPAPAAERLQRFVRTYFMGGRPREYTSFRFMDYVVGFTRRPGARLHREYRADAQIPAAFICPGKPYLLLCGVTPLLGMVGLGPNLVVTTFGTKGAFGVCKALDLVQVYGSDGVVEVEGLK